MNNEAKRLNNDTWTNIFRNLKEMGKEDYYEGADWVEIVWLDEPDEWCLCYGEELFEDGFKTEKEAQERLSHLENLLLKDDTEQCLSIYVGEMGISFWENQVVDSDEVRFKIEEDFGISHNRTMEIESFQDDMARFGYGSPVGQYIIVRDENHIAHLVEEYKMEE